MSAWGNERNEKARNANQAQQARGLVPSGSKMPDAPQKDQPRLKPKTYAAVPAQAMNDDRLKARDWRVLTCIAWHADPHGYAWPSQEVIRQETGLCRVSVSTSIGRLRKFGYLTIERKIRRHGHWAANTYRVVRLKPQEIPKPAAPCNHSDYTDHVATVTTDHVATVTTLTGHRTDGSSEQAIPRCLQEEGSMEPVS